MEGNGGNDGAVLPVRQQAALDDLAGPTLERARALLDAVAAAHVELPLVLGAGERAAFEREVREFRPELVVVEYWYASAYIDRAPGVPAVLFAHDIEYLARERAGAFEAEGSRGTAWAALEAQRERRALAAAPRIWFLTEGDRAAAVRGAGVPAERSAVLPHGLDLDEGLAARREGDPPEVADRVVFFGSFTADFNRDALEHTLAEIWPRVRRLRPEASLLVAGGGLPRELERRARAAGALVQGEVADVRALLLTASVVLVPLRYGGGLRIRRSCLPAGCDCGRKRHGRYCCCSRRREDD